MVLRSATARAEQKASRLLCEPEQTTLFFLCYNISMIRIGDSVAFLIAEFQKNLLPDVIGMVVTLSIPTLAILLFIIWWPLWVNYVRSWKFINTKYAVFEIKLPKETFKSPKAMELFLYALHNTSDGNFYKRFWGGESRPWYSLELASVEGKVKFYIWGEEGRKIGLMSALYAQFPGIEVREVPDYTKDVYYDPATMKVWAAEFKMNKKEPYPIKTYVDYGLHDDPKEELKVDPLVPGLEFLASVGAKQQVWIQLIVRAHKDEDRKKGTLFGTTDKWKDDTNDLIHKIMRRDPKTYKAMIGDEVGDSLQLPGLSDAEKELVAALSRKITKIAFDVCIRTIYIATKDTFNTPFGIGGLINFFKAYNTENLNGFKPNGDKWTPSLDAPWKDYKDIKRDRFSREGILYYKMRSAWFPPAEAESLVLNTEELATVYHFPGSVAATPTLERVPSKKGEAPANLPV